MIVCKIELWPQGQEDKARELSRMYIGRMGGLSEKPNQADYDVALMKKGDRGVPWTHGIGKPATGKAIRTGRVLGHNGQAYHVFRLVQRAIQALYPDW